jgi:hypothetical protein
LKGWEGEELGKVYGLESGDYKRPEMREVDRPSTVGWWCDSWCPPHGELDSAFDEVGTLTENANNMAKRDAAVKRDICKAFPVYLSVGKDNARYSEF